MKKQIIIISCLVFLSLACLTTSAIAEVKHPVIEMATRIDSVTATGTTPPTVEPTMTKAPERCARVIALKALHLRKAAGTSAEVIGYLKNGEVVRVLHVADADWWQVRRGDDIGFAKVDYLRDVECVK